MDKPRYMILFAFETHDGPDEVEEFAGELLADIHSKGGNLMPKEILAFAGIIPIHGRSPLPSDPDIADLKSSANGAIEIARDMHS